MEHTEFTITSKKFGEFVVLIDEDDREIVGKHTWHIRSDHGDFRAGTSIKVGGKYRTETLHRYIMEVPKGMSVDHINGNTLDNRKSNLRICKHSENCKNQKKRVNGISSLYKGVNFRKDIGKYQARISVDFKRLNIGAYAKEDTAARAYNVAAVKYHKEFARLNIIQEVA